MSTRKQEKYDVVVIGSGMGGMCSAALLARSGYRTLLVEKLDRLGGRWSTVEQEGFKLPTGAVCIATRGVIQKIFEECGAKFDVRETTSLTMWFEGKWQELPTKGQLRTLLSIIEKSDGDRAKVVGHVIRKMATEKIMGAFRGGPPQEKPGERASFRDWLLKYTDNEKVLQMFQALTSAISGVNDFEYPASHWFAYTSKHLGGQGGITYYALAPHGNVKVIESLANTAKNKGSEVWVGCPAKRIVVEGGITKGVIVQRDGEDIEIRAGVVICDGGPKRTVELAGRENFSDEYLNQVDHMRSVPTIEILVASDRPLTPAKGTMLVVGAKRIVTCVAMSAVCPELAPAGQHLMVVWGTPANCLQHLNVEEEIKASMEDIREVFPDFDKYGRILVQKTRDIDDEFPAYRSWHGYALNPDTSVENLYNVGDGVEPWGWTGLSGCAQGARLVSTEVKKGYEPKRP
jgi:phytoene desaturase